MNLQIATVLSCTSDGCLVQPIDGGATMATRYSAPVISHNIAIRPNQFVIVDTTTTRQKPSSVGAGQWWLP